MSRPIWAEADTQVSELAAALCASEARFRAIFDQAIVGVAENDSLTGRFIRVNQRYCEIVGRPEADLLSRTFMAISHADDLPGDLTNMDRLKRGELRSYTMEKRFVRPDGGVVWANLTISPIWSAGAAPTTHIAVLEDITARKRAEAERQKFVSLADSSPEFIGMCDLAFRPIYLNAAGLRMVGLDNIEAACRVSVPDYFFSEDQRFVTEEFLPRVLRDGYGEMEMRFRHFKTGRPLWMHCIVFSIRDEAGKVVGWGTVSRNVDERKRTEKQLRESTERYELVMTGSGAAIWDWDVPNRRVYYSPRWKEIRGYAEYEIGDSEEEWSSRIHPDDAPRVFRAVQAHFDGVSSAFSEEYRTRCKDGSWKWIHDRGLTRRDAAGHVVRMAGSETDITARKLAEAALSESEERLRLAAQATGFGTYDYDPQRRRSLWSDQLHAITGVPKSTAAIDGASVDLVHPDDREAVRSARERALAPDGPRRYDIEYRIVRPDGALRWLHEISSTFFGAAADAQRPVRVVGTVQDITERKRAEEELRRHRDHLEALVAQRTEEVQRRHEELRRLTQELMASEEHERRRLATEVHDGIGQMLALAQMKLGAVRQAAPAALAAAVTEVRQMIDQAIRASRTLTAELGATVLRELGLEAALEALAEETGQRHGLACTFSDDCVEKAIDEEMQVALYRAARELVVNVIKHARAQRVEIGLERSGGVVRLTVADDGVGLGDGAAEPAGRGGGFGLSSIHERVARLGGALRLSPRPGGGTQAVIEAPLVRAASSEVVR